MLDAVLAGEEQQFRELREEMVETQIRARGVRDETVLRAMLRVPRQLFVSDSLRSVAYADSPQTDWARADDFAALHRGLDDGIGSSDLDFEGDSRSVRAPATRLRSWPNFARLCTESRSSSRSPTRRQRRMAELGYTQVTIRCGDGYRGWPDQAPFDLIIVAAAPSHIPQPLVDQLAEGGRLVIPVGDYFQELMVVEKTAGGLTRQWSVAPVAFVPMTGEAHRRPASSPRVTMGPRTAVVRPANKP